MSTYPGVAELIERGPILQEIGRRYKRNALVVSAVIVAAAVTDSSLAGVDFFGIKPGYHATYVGLLIFLTFNLIMFYVYARNDWLLWASHFHINAHFKIRRLWVPRKPVWYPKLLIVWLLAPTTHDNGSETEVFLGTKGIHHKSGAPNDHVVIDFSQQIILRGTASQFFVFEVGATVALSLFAYALIAEAFFAN